MSPKVWTPSEIRKLARRHRDAKKNNDTLVNDLSVEPSVASVKPADSENFDSTELKGKLSYWNQFEESLGNRVVIAMPAEWDEDEPEIERLCKTLGLEVKEVVVLRSRDPDPSTFVGPGQLSRLKKALAQHEASSVVVDAPLRPSQVKNLEKSLKISVLDREGIILSIFQAHARTRQAQLQVEIAQLKYLLPRLSGVWMGLSRQRGAKGGLGGRGLGETRLELDRRVVKDRIAFLSNKMDEAQRSFEVQSARRASLPRVALVGYTNAGKSTLMKQLTRADVHIEDKLFATLDTTVRMLNPPTKPQILVSDTVGFVRDLPHNLVASFKSTLAESVTSRLLLHVVDISHPSWMDHFHTTEKVLEEIGAAKVPRILVLNKLDILPVAVRLRESQCKRLLKDLPDYIFTVPLSAVTGDGVDTLRDVIVRECGATIPDWINPQFPLPEDS
jgi:GTP-binding protein HflX